MANVRNVLGMILHRHHGRIFAHGVLKTSPFYGLIADGSEIISYNGDINFTRAELYQAVGQVTLEFTNDEIKLKSANFAPGMKVF